MHRLKHLVILALFSLPAFGACQTGFISIVDAFLNPDGTAWTGAITYTLGYNTTVAGATIVGARQNFNVTNGLSLCLAPGLYTPVTLQQSGQRYPVTTQWAVPISGGPYAYSQIAATTTISAPVVFGNTVFVDSVNGNNTTGQRGYASLPFKTVRGAIAATGLTSGDLIQIGPGTYNEATSPFTPVIFPDGVSVSGASKTSTILLNGGTTSLAISFIPGSNSVFAHCTVGTTNPDITFTNPPIGMLSSQTGTIQTNVELLDLNITGKSDGIYLGTATPMLTPVYWRVVNCFITTNWDAVRVTSGAGSPSWPAVVDLFDTTIVATYNGSTGTAWHGFFNNGAQTLVRMFGGSITVSGGPTGATVGALIFNGAEADFFGTQISASSTGSTVNSLQTPNNGFATKPIIKVAAATFDPKLLSIQNGSIVQTSIAPVFCTDAGALNAMTCAAASLAQYTPGAPVSVLPLLTNTAAVTLNGTAVLHNGVACTGGEFLSGVIKTVAFNGTSFEIQ